MTPAPAQAPLLLTDAARRRPETGAIPAARQAWRDAADRYAAASAHKAAVAARELLPDVETLVFEVTEGSGTFLVAAYDSDGDLIWFNPYATRAEYIDDPAVRDLKPQPIDSEAHGVIADALTNAYAVDPDYFPWSDLHVENCHNLHTLDIPTAADEYDPAPDTITFALLAKLLRRTAGIDPAGVDELIAKLRRDAAHETAHEWRWPKHTNTGGTWCPFSGQRVENPADWTHNGNTRCVHDCPGSEAVETIRTSNA